MPALALCREREAGERFCSSVDLLDDQKVNEGLTPPSSGEMSPVWNTASFRRSFPAAWGQYLKDKYRTAYAVQKAFPGIDSKTARDWISGKRDPSGSFVIAECKRDERALEALGRTA